MQQTEIEYESSVDRQKETMFRMHEKKLYILL